MASVRTARATEVRSRRATLKRAIRTGEANGLDLLAGSGTDWEEAIVLDMPLEALLRATPELQALAIADVLSRLKVPPDVRLYGLTLDRRREIARELAR